MSQPIEIESIARLDVNPGETLVVTLPTPVTRKQAQEIRVIFEANLPDGVKLLIKPADVKLEVVANEGLRPPPTDTDWLETENVGPM